MQPLKHAKLSPLDPPTCPYDTPTRSNPLAMGARVSRTLRTSEVDHPMHKKGLHRLQHAMDEFTEEVCVCKCVLVILDTLGVHHLEQQGVLRDETPPDLSVKCLQCRANIGGRRPRERNQYV